MRNIVFLASLVLGGAAPALALPSPPLAPVVNAPPPAIPPARDRDFLRLNSELLEIRRLGLELRADDGGTLTAEHRDLVQARIDAAFAEYRRRNPRR